jgi:hypothetical protein
METFPEQSEFSEKRDMLFFLFLYLPGGRTIKRSAKAAACLAATLAEAAVGT